MGLSLASKVDDPFFKVDFLAKYSRTSNELCVRAL